MAARWLSRSRVSMQRLGFCKVAVVLAPSVRSGPDMAELARSLLFANDHRVPHTERLEAWLHGNRVETISSGQSATIAVSLQQLYIYAHPSRSGWLSPKEGFKEYFEYFPEALELVNGTYDLTEIGAVLRNGLMADKEVEGIQRPNGNPLVLTKAQRLLFLHQILQADGDFCIPVLASWLSAFGDASFSYIDAGSTVPAVIDRVMEQFSPAVHTQTDRDQYQRLTATRDRIATEIEKHVEHEGSGSRREQTCIPRLEWLVDLGLAERRESRTWAFTATGLSIVHRLAEVYEEATRTRYPENVIQHILDVELYAIASTGYLGSPANPVQDPALLKALRPSYRKLAGITGYALLRPLVLQANCDLIASRSSKIIDYAAARDALSTLYQQQPESFTYTIDRFNTDYQLKLNL